MSAPPSKSWYAGKRAVVLGASGFLGRAVTARLCAEGASVVAASRGTATPAIEELRDAEIVPADVTVRNDMVRVLDGADVVFVMAGVSGAAASWDEPERSLHVNVGGLTNALDVLRERSPDARVVFPSSRLVYGRQDVLPVAERAPLRPHSPYALHKIACEQLLALYRERCGLRYAVARLTNPYGVAYELRAQQYNVISAMIARARGDDEIVVFGDGGQLRDYIFIDDAVDALLLLGSKADALVVNVGSGEGTRFLDVVEAIVELAGKGKIAFREWPASYAAVETGDFVADVTRARALGIPEARGIVDGLRQSLGR